MARTTISRGALVGLASATRGRALLAGFGFGMLVVTAFLVTLFVGGDLTQPRNEGIVAIGPSRPWWRSRRSRGGWWSVGQAVVSDPPVRTTTATPRSAASTPKPASVANRTGGENAVRIAPAMVPPSAPIPNTPR